MSSLAHSRHVTLVDNKRFRLEIRVVHVRDLNFVLRSEIFVNSGKQLRATDLILGCTPVYTTWLPFGPALLMDRLLLSYINMRHAKFLPPQLMVGEVRDLGPRYTTADSLAPVKDASADFVSQSCRFHVLVEEPEAPVQVAELAAAESVNCSNTDAGQGEKMMKRQTMTFDQFLPGTRPTAQPQHPSGKDRTSPPPPTDRTKKKQRITDQPSRVLSDAPSRTPNQVVCKIVIREPAGDSWTTAQVGTNVASSSQTEARWQATFKLSDKPLLASASSQAAAADKEDTPCMRELVSAIDTHMEMVDLKVTSNLNATENAQVQILPIDPPTEDAPERPVNDAV
ncbi:hypothetical protein SO802_013249 [Lithocarpus litseifolius]|uniref:Uncharacterized protein n=1 Tax=Lithocarpus litseifolius TaxID=425828 RepID=A0AAW2D533_9ROSI